MGEIRVGITVTTIARTIPRSVAQIARGFTFCNSLRPLGIIGEYAIDENNDRGKGNGNESEIQRAHLVVSSIFHRTPIVYFRGVCCVLYL